MKRRGGGKIVTIGSMTSISALTSDLVDASTKGAVVQLTKSLAIAWAKDNIQVNSILPGWIDTDLTRGARQHIPGLNDRVLQGTPAGRWGEPMDLAGTAVFLCGRRQRLHHRYRAARRRRLLQLDVLAGVAMTFCFCSPRPLMPSVIMIARLEEYRSGLDAHADARRRAGGDDVPGHERMYWLTCDTICATLKIMVRVLPTGRCLPFQAQAHTSSLCGSVISSAAVRAMVRSGCAVEALAFVPLAGGHLESMLADVIHHVVAGDDLERLVQGHVLRLGADYHAPSSTSQSSLVEFLLGPRRRRAC